MDPANSFAWISLATSAVSFLLAVSAIWISFYFSRRSARLAKDMDKLCEELSQAVEKLEIAVKQIETSSQRTPGTTETGSDGDTKRSLSKGASSAKLDPNTITSAHRS
jgi:biopolymer transport protein ExbB/TolQ